MVIVPYPGFNPHAQIRTARTYNAVLINYSRIYNKARILTSHYLQDVITSDITPLARMGHETQKNIIHIPYPPHYA